MIRVAIVDYGLANIQSVINAVACFDVELYLATSGDQLAKADRIILPGVGSFDAGMNGLQERGFVSALNDRVIQQKIPCLGICLGFQFFFQSSEEGDNDGLGWIDARVRHFDNKLVKVPHMGWNEVVLTQDSTLLAGLAQQTDFYFVHSYFVPFDDEAADCCVGYCDYQQQCVVVVEKDNIFGVQFHPEKSQLAGMKLIENFLQSH